VLPFATYIELKDKMDTILLWINVFSKNVDGTGLQIDRAATPGTSTDISLISRNKDELVSKIEMEELKAAIQDGDMQKVKSMLAGCQFRESDSRYRRQVRTRMRKAYHTMLMLTMKFNECSYSTSFWRSLANACRWTS
jgi:hypothetical protein